MANEAIPAMVGDGLAPPQGSAGAPPPVQVHQRNNQIPGHPVIQAQQHGTAPAAPAVPAAVSQESTQNTNDWDAFEAALDNDTDLPQIGAPPAAPASTSAAPATRPEEFPSLDQLLAPPVAAPVAPAQPAQPAAPASSQPAAPAAAPLNMEQIQRNAIDYLMANDYKLSDDQRTKLISEPDVVLPEMAARMHVGVATGIMQQLHQLIPAMIQQQVSGMISAQRAEMEFFGEYPQLNKPEFRPVVAESLAFVRNEAANRGIQLTREQVKKQGAAWAVFQIRSRGIVPQAPAAPPMAPAAPRAQMVPYVPVAPGAGATPPSQAPTGNIWADLASDPDLMNF